METRIKKAENELNKGCLVVIAAVVAFYYGIGYLISILF